MPASADSIVPYAGPILRDWDVLYEERFALARSAVQDDDLGMLAAMRARDRLNEVDIAVALRTESLLAALTTVDVTNRLRELAEAVREYSSSVRAAGEDTWRTTYELLRVVYGMERVEWQEYVDAEVDGLKTAAADGMEALRGWGKRKIRGLPSHLRPLAARVFTQGLQSVLEFFAKAVAWLCKARCATMVWFEKASYHVERWREKLVGWYFEASQEIEELFVAANLTLQQRRFLSRTRSFHREGGLDLAGDERLPVRSVFRCSVESQSGEDDLSLQHW